MIICKFVSTELNLKVPEVAVWRRWSTGAADVLLEVQADSQRHK